MKSIGATMGQMSVLSEMAARGIVASGAFSPSSISGLQLWFKADAQVYNDAGSTLASNNDNVHQWNDLSGNGRTASVGASFPVFKTAIINGLPVVRGTSHHLDLASAVTLSGAFTLYAVGSRVTSNVWIPAGKQSGQTFLGMYLDNNCYSIDDANTNVNSGGIGGGFNPTGNFLLRMSRPNAATAPIVRATGIAGGSLSGTDGTSTIDRILGSAVFGDSPGDFGEIVLYNAYQIDGGTNDTNMQTYFTGRYGFAF